MGINFPASPTVGQRYPQPAVAGIPVYTWDGEKWTTVGGSIAAYAPPADAVPLMNATPGMVGVATKYAREDHRHPTDASLLAYSGMQINGGMDVSQEKGSTLTTTNSYICDGWLLSFVGTMVPSASVGGPGIFASVGLINNMGVGFTTAQASLGASDYVNVIHRMEGYRMARLQWGTANAQPITIGFWSAHNRIGLYSVGLRNGAGNRSYAFTYTQAVTNAPQYNVVTIPGDATGTWTVDNTVGMTLSFSNGTGTTFTAPSANTWVAGNYLAAPGQVNGVAATSDVFRITGVTIHPGTQAPTAAQSPFIMRPYGEELEMCKRYWQKIYVGWTGDVGTSGGYAAWALFPVTPRAAPTFTGTGFQSGSGQFNTPTATGNITYVQVSAVASGTVNGASYLIGTNADARL